MALKCETASPPNGVANIVEESTNPQNEDLEDGEIFDDDDEEVAPIPTAKGIQKSTEPEPPSSVNTSSLPSSLYSKRSVSPGGAAGGNDRKRFSQPSSRTRRASKRPREDDNRSLPRTKQRRRSEEGEKIKNEEFLASIDEEELLNVSRVRTPPPRARSNDQDRFNKSDEEDEDENGGNRRNRRDGFQPRRRPRSRGEGGSGSRGSRDGRRGGGRRDLNNICKFYLLGKCHKGYDCPFPHYYPSNRKFELCKFYMNDCCAKKEKCLFMHSDFPCKYFHLGQKCYAGKRCKFSHTRVMPYVKQQLIKHNQGENDKKFLHNLKTLSPRESPVREYMKEESSSPPPTHHHYRGRDGGGVQHHRDNNRHQQRNERHHNHQVNSHSGSPAHSEHEDNRGYRSNNNEDRNNYHNNDDRNYHNNEDRDYRHEDKDYRVEDRDYRDEDRDYRNDERQQQFANAGNNDRNYHHNERNYFNERSYQREEQQRNYRHEERNSYQAEQSFDSRSQQQTNQETNSYSDDEKNRTPMPSPSQDNSSERDMKSPDRELTCDYNSSNSETPASEQKDSGLGDEMPHEVPLSLPPKQRELYLRIQQQQRHAEEAQNAEGGLADKEDDFKEEDWYSSDEDTGNAPLATILKTIKAKKPLDANQTLPKSLPDFDISEVSKLLSSVRETIQQQQSPQHKVSSLQDSEKNSNPEVKRRVRDPRLRTTTGSPLLPVNSPVGNDVDLRLSATPPLALPMTSSLVTSTSTSSSSSSASLSMNTDVDLRQLPFKPAPIHQAANEIDASITSHPPVLNYSMIQFPTLPKPDYSYVQPKNLNDPRLQKYAGQPQQTMPLPLPSLMGGNSSNKPPTIPSLLTATPSSMSAVAGTGISGNHSNNSVAAANNTTVPSAGGLRDPRDPRQRVIPNDPRRKPLLPTPILPPSYHHKDSDLRSQAVQQFSIGNDVDLRFHQKQQSPNFYD